MDKAAREIMATKQDRTGDEVGNAGHQSTCIAFEGKYINVEVERSISK